jgi:hypothetical protein
VEGQSSTVAGRPPVCEKSDIVSDDEEPGDTQEEAFQRALTAGGAAALQRIRQLGMRRRR